MAPQLEDPTLTFGSTLAIATAVPFSGADTSMPIYGVDTRRLLRNTMSRSWDLFHFLNKSSDAEPEYYLSSLVVITGVCDDADGTQKNCAKICSDNTRLFSSWQTLWQCLTLASFSLAGESFPGLNESSHQLIDQVLNHFSISKATDFPGEIVFNHTFNCAVASCTGDSTGNCEINKDNSSYIEDGRFRWDIMYEIIEDICEGIETDTNTDVAGPGVLLSYIFQMGMAVYVWGFILIPKVLETFAAMSRFFRRLLHKFGFKIRIFSNRTPTSRRFAQTNLAHATSTFLVEFHEAQCFFVTSIEIALLYAKSRARASGSNNWATLSMFTATIQHIAVAGAWPIILTQVSLSRAHLDSIYYLTLSTLALILASVTILTAVEPTVDEVYRAFRSVNKVSECGENTSMRSFCLKYNSVRLPFFGATAFLPFLSLICILWLAKIRDAISDIPWQREKYRCLTESQQRIILWTRWTLSKLSVVVFFLGELGTLLFLGFSLYQLQGLGEGGYEWELDEDPEGDGSEWGVGQIIAVLIWAPVVAKYVYLIIFGIEKGFLYRLSRAFVVVKRPIEVDSDDEGDTVPEVLSENDAMPLMPVR